MCEDTIGVIISHKSKTDRKYTDQKRKTERTNNYLQNITQKTKDRTTRTPLKPVNSVSAPVERAQLRLPQRKHIRGHL